MIALVTLSALLIAADPPAGYDEARARACRTPEAQVRLALWCEAHGLPAERLRHLAMAVMADPANPAARGLMGLVEHAGKWQRPEDVARQIRDDPARLATLAEYDARRQKAPYKADAQSDLGVWCEEHGLREQARAHLTATVRLDPTRETAWKRLGYKKHEGRWVTDAQLAAEKAEAEAQKQSDRKWRPLLEKWKGMLAQPSRREEAEASLLGLTDPRAVPTIVHAFGTDRPADQLRAVRLLGQVDAPSASRSLAALAVFSKSAEVRRLAIVTLKRRDPRDFVRLWIGLIRDPIKYEVRKVGGPGSPGSLFIEGPKANLKRVYSPSAAPTVANIPGTRVEYDANGLPVLDQPLGRVGRPDVTGARIFHEPIYSYDPGQLNAALGRAAHGEDLHKVLASQAESSRPAGRIVGYNPYFIDEDGSSSRVTSMGGGAGNRYRLEQEQELKVPIGQMILEAEKSAADARRKLADDVAAIDGSNAEVRRANELARQALGTITGRDLGDDSVAWGKWWSDQEGYAFHITDEANKPTILQDVPSGYTPQAMPQVVGGSVVAIRSHSCFGAGTSVRTIQGVRPIESIRSGDLILVQDTKSGGLSYQPVVAPFHNPPNATFRVHLGEDAVVATGIHRFWKAGHGWAMARDLKPGDVLRTLGGVAVVSSVAAEETQPVFNLEVAEGHDFFVGQAGALVHDNSLVEATPAPFDAPPP